MRIFRFAFWAALVLAPDLLEGQQVVPPSWNQYGVPRIDVEISGHKGFLHLPPGTAPNHARPWVWYAPVLTGKFPETANAWLFTRLLEKGVAIAGVDVGESYGSPGGRRLFTEFYTLMVKKYRLSRKVCLLPQSRGGLMLYNWAAEHAGSVQCIGGIYPVGNLESYPGLRRTSGAYNMTEAELKAKLPEHNPIDRLRKLAAKRVPILHIHGDSDKLVPLETNSLELARRYRALGGRMELIIVKGKGHEAVPEFFESEDLLAFFLSQGKTRPASDPATKE